MAGSDAQLASPPQGTTAADVNAGSWWLPLARYGLREIASITIAAAILAVVSVTWWWPGLIAVGGLWLALLMFFRDPPRAVPRDDLAWVAPADGTLTEITRLAHDERIGGPAVRLGIFLSIFNVHLNRSPCAGVVKDIEYRRGGFHDARSPLSSTENESNTLVLDAGPVMGTVVIKQIAGLIARRIVCAAAPGDALAAGQRIGMIKFGSRTELVLARPDELEITVKVGDAVRAGVTIMARRRRSE
jgi:phosphatidylserine decarboxylase